MQHSLNILNQELTLSPQARFLKKHGLLSAALYYKNLNETVERRAARASRFVLETMDLPVYQPGQWLPIPLTHSLFRPSPLDDPQGWGLWFDMDGFGIFREDSFRKLYVKCENSAEYFTVDTVIHNCRAMVADIGTKRYNHHGIHNVVDFEFILHHGLRGYRERIGQQLADADPKKKQFEEAMLDVLEGMESFLQRYVRHLEETLTSQSGDTDHLSRLIHALRKVPLGPAETFFEAWVSCCMAMSLSGCNEPGRLDAYLLPYYERDLARGTITKEETFALIRAMLVEIDNSNGHPGVTHVTIGGTNPDGSPCYNELTEICIRAIAGLRAPNVTLRVRKDMPDHLESCPSQSGAGLQSSCSGQRGTVPGKADNRLRHSLRRCGELCVRRLLRTANPGKNHVRFHLGSV